MLTGYDFYHLIFMDSECNKIVFYNFYDKDEYIFKKINEA